MTSVETRKPTIIHHGPVAEHDMACAVFHRHESAVLNLDIGVFEPSWKARSEGWRLIRARTRFQKLVWRLVFDRPTRW